MTNNDIFKKLRVALQLRDDQIVDILELVDFRISKGEIGNFFRNEDHPKYMECGDQVLRNFLNGLVIFLRGTKEQPKNPLEVLKQNTTKIKSSKKDGEISNNKSFTNKSIKSKLNPKKSKTIPIVEKVKYKNGKS